MWTTALHCDKVNICRKNTKHGTTLHFFHIFRWKVTNYSDCSVTCGNGTIFQVAKCIIQAVNEKGPYSIEVF